MKKLEEYIAAENQPITEVLTYDTLIAKLQEAKDNNVPIEEGIIGSLVGGLTGLTFGPKVMKAVCKGSRGLFVPSRVIGIFTDTTISPSSWLRQCPDHFTIRAGRNLPDKEFRYLRTVIVTAAVYRGFNSALLLR